MLIPMGLGNWKAEPSNGFWNDGANWDGGTVPTGSATFGKSTITSIGFTDASAATILSIEFGPDADAYTFSVHVLASTPALTIEGAGVVNQSTKTQHFVVASQGTYNQPQLKFIGSASAGSDLVSYYAGPTSLEDSFGGGTIEFCDEATGGSAHFVSRTGKMAPPNDNSTLGGQIVFRDRTTAGTATFSIWGTLGTDGDTFGNAVFHDTASADHATFTNNGGTVPGGDGGNTQFYDTSSAAHGLYLNYGGTAHDTKLGGANGGDVAFDGNATGGHGHFNNYPATVSGANGGVTSFNNNPNYPTLQNAGASAGNGCYLNFGATTESPGGGGHTELTARYGFSNAGQGSFYNFGSALNESWTAGHTIFAIKPPNEFFPSAGNGTFWNLPGAAGGYTVFQSYGDGTPNQNPTAGTGTFHNLGGSGADQQGGYTRFRNTSKAENATLISHTGANGGTGGTTLFEDRSQGDGAHVQLIGNGALDLTGHDGALTIGTLSIATGILRVFLGTNTTTLVVSNPVQLSGGVVTLDLSFPEGETFTSGQQYDVLQAPNLSQYSASQFAANKIGTADPVITIDGSTLKVAYHPSA